MFWIIIYELQHCVLIISNMDEYVKAGYIIPDPIEGNMHFDVIVLCRNDV